MPQSIPYRVIISALLIVAVHTLQAQPYINKVSRYDRPEMLYSSIYADNASYTVIGVASNINQPTYPVAILGRMDHGGTLTYYKAIYDSVLKEYGVFTNCLIKTNNNGYAFTGYSFDSLPRVLLVLSDSSFNNTRVYEYQTPYSYSFYGLELIQYGDSYYIAGVRTDSTHLRSNVLLMKIDSSGNEQWEKYYGTPTNAEWATSLIKLKNNNLMMGSFKNDLAQQNQHAYTWLLEVDTGGNLVRQWYDPNDSTYAAEGLKQTSDGGFIYGAQKKFEQTINDVYLTGTLVKMDSAFNKQWTHQEGWENVSTGIFDIEEMPDGGFIGCGNQPFWKNDSTIVSGWIIKISSSGNVIWDKKYAGMIRSGAQNYLYDVDLLPDGSIVAVGESRSDTLVQGAWFLKVDSNGCEVENCLTGIAEPNVFQLQLQAYPNPFNNQLLLILSGVEQTNHKVIYTITNIVGQVVYHQQEDNLSNNYTKMLDLSYLPNGLYIVDINTNGEHITQKVVKQ